jgi:hypothetical protein
MATEKDGKSKKSSPNASKPKHRARQKATPAILKTTENRRRALQLRVSGLTFDEISDVMGLGNRGAAYKLVNGALEDTRKEIREDAERYVAEDLHRIDRLMRAIWPMALGNTQTGTAPDLKAIDRVEKLLARKSRMLGLDAPVRAELSGPGGAPIEVSDAKQRLLDRLNQIQRAQTETVPPK